MRKFWKDWGMAIASILMIVFGLIATKVDAQVYIDPSTDNSIQDGTIEYPFNSWSDITRQANQIYLQKRGTVEHRTSSLMTLASGQYQNIVIGAYGQGERPIIHFSDCNGIYLKYTSNIVIQDLELIGNYGNNGRFYNDAIYISGHTSGDIDTRNTSVINCKIHRWGAGINALVFNGGTEVRGLCVDGCEIFDIGDDGIFGGIENLTVKNSHIYKVNRHWYTVGHSQYQSGGDCIHFRGNNYLIENNILDRSNTGNKFCLIYGSHTYHPDRGKIIGNTFYPPQDTVDDDGGACLYVSQSAYVEVAYNKFLGRGYSPSGGTHIEVDTLDFYYNIVDSVYGFGATIGSNPKTLSFVNNTFLNQDKNPVLLTFDSTKIVNNIFQTDQRIINSSTIPDSTHNLIGEFLLSDNCEPIHFDNGFDYAGYMYDINGNPIDGSRDIGAVEKQKEIIPPVNDTVYINMVNFIIKRDGKVVKRFFAFEKPIDYKNSLITDHPTKVLVERQEIELEYDLKIDSDNEINPN